MQSYSVYTARLTTVSYNRYIKTFAATDREAAKEKVTGPTTAGGLNLNLYYYIIVENNTGKIIWNQHEKEFKTYIPTPAAETEAELLQIFIKANIILTASVLKADNLRKQAANITAKRTKNISLWIDRMNKADQLKREADRTENRGRKCWNNTTDFQGKYINYRNLTKDQKPIFDIIMKIGDTYETNLQAAKKLAGTN